MTEKMHFDQHFANAITGFQEKKTSNGVETHINLGSNTVRFHGDLKTVLREIFPCTVQPKTPVTYIETKVLHLQGEVRADQTVYTFADPIGW